MFVCSGKHRFFNGPQSQNSMQSATETRRMSRHLRNVHTGHGSFESSKLARIVARDSSQAAVNLSSQAVHQIQPCNHCEKC